MIRSLILLALLVSVSLACTLDSECGGPDQAGLCVAGTCQCGVGFAGATLVDPASCSQVCVPPAVPDSVAFLNEPIIGLAAIAGDLTLNVTMDVNSKQIPTTVAWQHPVTGTECDLMPGALGSGRWTQQVNDAAQCDSVLVYRAPFSAETARDCWETLATRQETSALYQTTFSQYRSRVEVVQSGLAPFGQSVPTKRQSSDETSITRQFRREYTISVATQFSVISDQFQVVAGGRVLYRLVEIDYDLLNNQIIAVIETQVADTARLASSAVNSESSSGISSLNGAVTFDAACDPAASSAGNCNQFHRVPFSDEPCAVTGASLVLNVEFQCADGSDAGTCGYTDLPVDRIYALPNLILDYDACPRAIEYGIDGAASSIRLYTDPGRTTDVTAPVLQGTILYGQCEIFPTANAEFQSNTLTALKVFQVASPANLDLGDQLSSTFLTLTSGATQTSPASAVWQFSLDIDAAFFDITQTYFLEATIELTFANTGSLTKRLIIPLLPGRKRSNTAVALLAAGAPRQAQEGNSDQVRSNIFKMAAEEREDEEEAPVSGSASTAIIAAGAAIGAIALVAIAAILIVFAVKKRRRREEEEENVQDIEVQAGETASTEKDTSDSLDYL